MSTPESDAAKPDRKYVDITFWLAHAAFLAGIVLIPPPEASKTITGPMSYIPVLLIIIGSLVTIAYFFAIGRFATRMGRSALVWGGLAFLFSPVGIWVSFVASYFIDPKTK